MLKAFKKSAQTLAAILVPVIPAIVAAGLLKGLNCLLQGAGTGFDQAAQLLDTMATTTYLFLPVLTGWSASKRFGASPVLGILMGALLVHPDLTQTSAAHWQIFGLAIPKSGYQNSVFPAIFTVYVLSVIERYLKKIVPSAIDLLVVPMSSVFISGVLAFVIIAPLAQTVATTIVAGILKMMMFEPAIGAALYGALYAPLVITGMHHVFLAVNIQLLAQTGATGLWPIEALANITQAAAATGVYTGLRNAKIKRDAAAAIGPACFGVTEQALFGISLRLVYPLICAMAGAAVAAAYIAINDTQALGIGIGGLPAFVSMRPDKILTYLAGMIIAGVITFVLTTVVARIRN